MRNNYTPLAKYNNANSLGGNVNPVAGLNINNLGMTANWDQQKKNNFKSFNGEAAYPQGDYFTQCNNDQKKGEMFKTKMANSNSKKNILDERNTTVPLKIDYRKDIGFVNRKKQEASPIIKKQDGKDHLSKWEYALLSKSQDIQQFGSIRPITVDKTHKQDHQQTKKRREYSTTHKHIKYNSISNNPNSDDIKTYKPITKQQKQKIRYELEESKKVIIGEKVSSSNDLSKSWYKYYKYDGKLQTSDGEEDIFRMKTPKTDTNFAEDFERATNNENHIKNKKQPAQQHLGFTESSSPNLKNLGLKHDYDYTKKGQTMIVAPLQGFNSLKNVQSMQKIKAAAGFNYPTNGNKQSYRDLSETDKGVKNGFIYCIKCQKNIGPGSKVIFHRPAYKKGHKDIDTKGVCNSLFVQMLDCIKIDPYSISGKINCPGCKVLLGESKFSGLKCLCGHTQVPAYQLYKSKVLLK